MAVWEVEPAGHWVVVSAVGGAVAKSGVVAEAGVLVDLAVLSMGGGG